MDQDATWYGGRPWPRPHCARWGPSSLSNKGAQPHNFRPMSVVAKQLDGSRYHLVGGRPWPRRLCVEWRPSSTQKKGHSPSPNYWHVYSGQMAGWIKMPLATKVNPCPGDVVIDGVTAPLQPLKEHSPPVFGPCPLWPKGWMDEDATWYGSRLWPRPHCVRQGPSSFAKRAQQPPSFQPPLFSPCLLWPRLPISATAELL